MKSMKKCLSIGIVLVIALLTANVSNCAYTGYPGGRGSDKHADYRQNKAMREYKAATADEPATMRNIQTLSDMIMRSNEKINALEKRINSLERTRK